MSYGVRQWAIGYRRTSVFAVVYWTSKSTAFAWKQHQRCVVVRHHVVKHRRLVRTVVEPMWFEGGLPPAEKFRSATKPQFHNRSATGSARLHPGRSAAWHRTRCDCECLNATYTTPTTESACKPHATNDELIGRRVVLSSHIAVTTHLSITVQIHRVISSTSRRK